MPEKNKKRGELKNNKSGPKADRLKLDGDWKEAVKKGLQKPPPRKDKDRSESK